MLTVCVRVKYLCVCVLDVCAWMKRMRVYYMTHGMHCEMSDVRKLLKHEKEKQIAS